jgi:hypothetical protein
MKFILLVICVVFVSVPAIAVQNLPPASVDSTKIERTIGVCQLIENPPPAPPGNAANSFMPTGSAWSFMRETEKVKPELLTDEMLVSAKASLLQDAEHGKLVDEGSGYYHYDPTSGYLGTDRAVIHVEMGSYKVRVIYHFKVMKPGIGGTEGYDPYMQKENCPNGIEWKISRNSHNLRAVSYNFEIPLQLASAVLAQPYVRAGLR